MATKKELQERTIEHLRGMCLKAGLDPSGSRAALIDRLLSPKGRVLPPPPTPISEPTEPEPKAIPEPEEAEAEPEAGEGEGGPEPEE